MFAGEEARDLWGVGPGGLGKKEKDLHEEGWYVEVNRVVTQIPFGKIA